ncbi:MAG: hypothetical protein ABW221_28625 [Vicinamibacteria bacterium]
MSRRAALALTLALSGPASAQDPGALVRGVVVRSAADAAPPHLVVRLDDGAEVEVTLSTRARVSFAPALWTFDTPPLLADVQAGMRVELRWDPRRVERVRVLEVPAGTRAGVPVEMPAESWGGTKARPAAETGQRARHVLYGVLVSAEREAVTVEVEGRRYRYLTAGRDLARGLRRGARIRLEVEADAEGKPVAVTRVF